MHFLTSYIQAHFVEIAGTVLSLIYLLFSIRQHILLWLFGLLSSALYIAVFFDAKLYADMSLQFYYVAVSVYGWIHWKYGNKEDKQAQLTTTTTGRNEAILVLIATACIYILYYLVLKYLSDSPIPVLDSFVGALSITGTWMLAKKRIENWLVWIVVDAFCTGLYAWKALYPTAGLYAVYTIMAVVGYRQWKKDLPKN